MKQRSNVKSCCFNNRSRKIRYERLEQTSGIQGSSFALVCAEPEFAGSDSFHWPGLRMALGHSGVARMAR